MTHPYVLLARQPSGTVSMLQYSAQTPLTQSQSGARASQLEAFVADEQIGAWAGGVGLDSPAGRSQMSEAMFIAHPYGAMTEQSLSP